MTYALHAHDLDPRVATGIARYARGLVGGLRANGEDALIATARGCGTVPDGHLELPWARRDLNKRWWLARRPLLEDVIGKVDPHLTVDVVHATAPIIPLPTRKPLVVTVHDLTPATHPEWFAPAAQLYFRRCLPWIRRRADAVIVPTQIVADEVHERLRLGDRPVVVTSEGVDATWLREDPSGEVLRRFQLPPGGYLLHLGAVNRRKNLAPLLEAVAQTDQLLVLAGPAGLGAQAVQEAAAARPDRIRLLGRVDDDDVGPLVRGARALVHPSLYEGFGLTVIEAMAVGTPVICSDGGALPEVAGDAALVAGTTSNEQWAAAIEAITSDSEHARLRAAGLTRSAQFRWDDVAAATAGVYRRIAG